MPKWSKTCQEWPKTTADAATQLFCTPALALAARFNLSLISIESFSIALFRQHDPS